MKGTKLAVSYYRAVRSGAVRVCLAALVLLAGVIPALAFADDLPGSSGLSDEHLNQALDAPIPEIGPLTDPGAAEELPHRNLGREEAVELTEAVFDPILEDAVGPIQGLDVDRYLGDNAAIVSSAAPAEAPVEINGDLGTDTGASTGQPVLLESTLPLRTEGPDGGREPVDLSLEVSGDVLEPTAPLVQIELPRELGDGIQLLDTGVSIELPEAPSERAPSILNETVATYPNIAVDTDFSAIPTPTGFETLTTLRSPDAPKEQTFQLSLPPGAALLQAGEGAEVEQDAKTILKVLPPSAIDAAGADVPVSLDIDGNSLILTATPDAATQYPVLVDPLFESYDWYTYQAQSGQDTWYSQSNRSGMETSKNSSGLFLKARHEFPYSPGSQVEWAYFPPRYKAEQAQGRSLTSFIQKMTLWHLAFTTQPGGTLAPYMFAGIWGNNGWAGKPGGYAVWAYAGNLAPFYMNAPGNGMLVEFENGEPAKRDETAQMGIFGLASTEFVPPTTQTRFAAAGAASVEVADMKPPQAGDASFASSWVDQTATEPLTATAEDTGLGVKNISFGLPGGWPKVVPHGCAGTVGNPCPLSWTATLPANQVNPAEMPQGFNYVPIGAEDVVGNKATQGSSKATLKVDHTKPSLALSGSLTEQAKVGTTAAQYALKYDVTDGDFAPAAALTPLGTAGTGVGQIQRPMGVAQDLSGNLLVLDRERNKVIKLDSAGNFISEFGAGGTGTGQLNDPRGFAVSPNGNIWIAEFGNKRVEGFTANGEFIRALQKPGFGGLVEPYAVATGPGGVVWVSDIASDAVFKFKEDGTYIGKVEGTSVVPTLPFTDLKSPQGLATDKLGNLWVTDNELHRVFQFDGSTLKFKNQFGVPGSGDGQFKLPMGLAVANSGHVLVVDAENNRVQVFQSNGRFLRTFGTLGTANNQLKEPRAVAVGPDNSLYVADAGNKRISRWSHADLDFQSGATSTEVKIDGGLAVPKYTRSCEDSCTINREWQLNADNYSVGQHNVEVIATDGVGLSTSKSLTIETHGDLKAPTIAVSGSMTEQGTLGKTRPRYVLKVNATDPGGAEERKSGVASATIKVDGKVVDTTSPGCPAGACSLSREWILKSDDYSTGLHQVQVSVTDGAGRTATKLLTPTINRDTTPPQLTAPSNFFTAPEGWVEQKAYAYGPSALDPNGYGVTSMQLKIDGVVAKTAGQVCPDGGCGLSPAGTVDMEPYAGGAHNAELIASDGAGNVAKKTWTLNVDPDGSISASEAEDTLEAVEATDPEAAVIAPNSELIAPAELAAGNDPVIVEDGSGFTVSGAPVETQFTSNPADGLTIPTPDVDLEVEPIGGAAGGGTVISGPSAAVTPNTLTNVDTVVRPTFSGVTNFQVIRSPQAAETFSWKVNIHPGQSLELVDSKTAQVVNKDGTSVMLISGESARDATGKAVPTSLQVLSSNVIQLTVAHQGGGYSYPVTAGPSFEVGYSTVTVIPPLPSGSAARELETLSTLVVGAPEAVPASEATGGASASSAGEKRRPFWRSICGHKFEWFESEAGVLALLNHEGRCGNAFDPTSYPGEAVVWRGTMKGMFLFTPGKEVRHREARSCATGTPVLSSVVEFKIDPAYECRYGPKTSDGNGGISANAGHYLRAQAHWILTYRGRCPLPPSHPDCPPPSAYPWEPPFDKALELHLWPSGAVEEHVNGGFP